MRQTVESPAVCIGRPDPCADMHVESAKPQAGAGGEECEGTCNLPTFEVESERTPLPARRGSPTVHSLRDISGVDAEKYARGCPYGCRKRIHRIQFFDGIDDDEPDIFPEAGDMAIESDTRLGDIPEWDSMNAVNLQTYLEKRCAVSIPLELLIEDTTVGELIRFMTQNIKKTKDKELPTQAHSL